MGVSICLSHAVKIQRSRPRAEWREAIEEIPQECRAECREYLRNIYRLARDAQARSQTKASPTEPMG